MKTTRILRPDGRYLIYYSFDAPPPDALAVEQPARDDDAIELRWNALLDEWVIVSTGRQERTFLPPPEYCPLCPTAGAGAFPTEIPSPSYEIVVFENRFPSFRPDAPEVAGTGPLGQRAAARGACEVVVYSPEHDGTLASMPLTHVRRLVDVWAHRYAELSARHDVACVFIFENRGREVGVTLTHPHGQIYAFPFVPPRVEQEHRAAERWERERGGCLGCAIVAGAVADGRRVVAETEGFVAYVPFAARMPYEVHVAAKEHRASLLELTDGERDGLASLLREVQATYDALWGFAMPYTMSMHQRATDEVERAGDHLHVEFVPPYRSRDKLKYLAGVETGAGTFINDTSPEEKAEELRGAAGRRDAGSSTAEGGGWTARA
ncbi:MAG TPA: galactose-1-phosphate uridylyltransferase [Dehalococcoidia bacterium]|nr:galactose-1-phosphate uridylyltransferase [Dehalococcoidia bacterium]